MSEVEDPFIWLEPSCDVHLVLDPAFPDDRRSVALRVFRGLWNTAERHHALSVLTDDVAFDWFGVNGAEPSEVVTLEPPDADGRRRLVPHARGQVLAQVRFMDPLVPDKYEYLVARIRVHEKMDGWWFGHERVDIDDIDSSGAVSVFKHAVLAHTQPTVFALFDKDLPETNGGLVADVSGHGYVRLESADPSICVVDSTYADRLRGVEVGETRVAGTLDLPYPDFVPPVPLTVRVIDPHVAPANGLEAVAGYVHRGVDPRTKLNLVFLSEGFTSHGDEANIDRTLFLKAVTELTDGLFKRQRHAPYPMLRKHFNVWYHYQPSRHRGLTPAPELTYRWWTDFGTGEWNEYDIVTYIPREVAPAKTMSPDAYALSELLLLVGLPAVNERRTVEELRAAWSAPDALPRFLGYRNELADDNVIEAWRRLKPRGIAIAPDTYYGLYQGSRWGDRFSDTGKRAAMIVQPAAGASEATRRAFIKRVHEWFNPRNVVRSLRFDPRRYAPEYHRAGLRLLVQYATQLEDRRATDPIHRAVGVTWDPKTPVEAPGDVRHYNSAGLICMVINSAHQGGTAEKDVMFRVALGRKSDFSPLAGEFPSSPRTRITRHGAFFEFAVEMPDLVDALAHELGHSFYGLGDEYEQQRGAPPEDDLERYERYDNITLADKVVVRGITVDPAFPTPVDPGRAKWALLHRIVKADQVLKPTEIGESAGPERSKKIIVTLAAGRAPEWQKAMDDGELVWLRKLNVPAKRSQLPIDTFDDIYEELEILSIPDDRTIVLYGEESLDPVPFPTGSVLFIPKRDRYTDTPLTIVADPVLEYMENHSWNASDPDFPKGISLSENHNAGDAKQSDRVQKARDVPPSISDFTGPCQPHRVIGLYEGGATWTRKVYRPAGACKMRSHEGDETQGEFCFVCKYLQINLVDPGLHPEVEKLYPDTRKKKKRKKKK